MERVAVYFNLLHKNIVSISKGYALTGLFFFLISCPFSIEAYFVNNEWACKVIYGINFYKNFTTLRFFFFAYI